MYPNLSYLFHDIFGTNVDNFFRYFQMFGTFLALAFFVSAYFLFLELRRQKGLGVYPPHLTKNEKGELKETYPHERVGDILMIAAISGMIGAKVFAIFESAENVKQFLDAPIQTLFSPSGIAIYGGLVFGFIFVYIFVKRWLKVNPVYVMDAVAPALIFGYSVGRIGCQLSGDGDWGIDNAAAAPSWWFLPKWMWSFDYPHNVIDMGEPILGFVGIHNRHLHIPVFPTPFYETILAALIGLFLWSIRKKLRHPGALFYIYLILNGIERFFIEKIRINDKLHAFGLTFTQAELIATIIFFIGIVGLVYSYRRKDMALYPLS